MQLHFFDLIIILSYLAFALYIGFKASQSSGKGLNEFFVAGRNTTWFVAGTSMVATTFAADTPLWVTGKVAQHGIAGNWFWWNLALGHLLAAIVFAPLWRRSEVITDAEFVELRYGEGLKEAAILRGVKAFYFAVIFNVITMGWVILAMLKIAKVFLRWEVILPSSWATFLNQIPLLQNYGTQLVVILLIIIAVIYSAFGGLQGVMLTDIAQFILSIVGAVCFAVVAVWAVGGLDQIQIQLESIYGDAQAITSFFPSSGNTWLPASVFAVYIGIQWWSQKNADGGGYFVQRMGAVTDDVGAKKATLWFCIAQYALRPWPWILVGLVALILYPLQANPGLDREALYPLLAMELLPVGFKGILVASLLAAFMSTIDTHINWGASYLVKDIYQRFLRPGASQKELVFIARMSVVGMAFLAIVVALVMGQIDTGWKLFYVLGSGWGGAIILRWLWWRANAWTEISALLLGSFIGALCFIYDQPFHMTVIYTVSVATIGSIAVTFATKPVPVDLLKVFYKRVHPPGLWQPIQNAMPEPVNHAPLKRLLVQWGVAIIMLYSAMFGVGYLLLGPRLLGGGLLVLAGITGVWVWKQMK